MYVSCLNIFVCTTHLVIKSLRNHLLWFTRMFRDLLKYLTVLRLVGLYPSLMIVLEWLGFFLLKDKAAISTLLPNFCKLIATQFGSPIKKLRTDMARDYFNHYLYQFFQQEGIAHESSCVDTPQQNGVVERKMRHLLNVARSLLHHYSDPSDLFFPPIHFTSSL